MPEPFAVRYRAAVENEQLGRNLLSFERGWREIRDRRFAADASPAADFDALRASLVAAKNRMLADHERFIDTFSRNAASNGMTVQRAADASEAVALIADICKRHGATTLLKTKSMVSEEIRLNHELAPHGIEAVETDIGEWIMQLRDEIPAHMVMPAIHLNRRQIAQTLEDATGHEVSKTDVGEQVTTVREALRSRFLGMHIGLTGANALVAETGSVLLVTNEGNESLLTAMADVHIVLVGIEKLLPSLADAATQVRLLARSATGQLITTYTTLISGPQDGQQIHVILLDNGRRAMRQDPEFVDALRCIRCAACASVCPPFAAVGGQVFGHIYSGAIGLVNTPFHHGLEAAAGPQSLCVSCNACQEVCPVDIPLPRQILAVRRRVAEADGLSVAKRLAFAVWRRPQLFNAVAGTAAAVSAPLRRGDATLRLPRPRRQRWRSVPALARRPAHHALAPRTRGATTGPLAGSAARGMRVAFFIQCLTDRLMPPVAEATVRLIAACGADVLVPPRQPCCGLPMFDSGDWNSARALARQTIAALESAKADLIVSGANSCVVAMLHDYETLFEHDDLWSERAAALAKKTVDLGTFLDSVARVPDAALHSVAATPPHTYHPFCQTRTILHADGAARRLLRDVCGLDLRELAEDRVCCGFGGSTSITAPEVGHAIAERKLGCIDAAGASVVVSDNPGCLLHLRTAAAVSGRTDLRFQHLAEVLAAQLQRVENEE